MATALEQEPFVNSLNHTLINYIEASKSSQVRQDFLGAARKFWKIYRSKEWWYPSKDADVYGGKRPNSIENVVHSTVETMVSVFYKHLPVIELRPQKPSDFDLVREQNKHLEYAMKEADFLEVMREGSRECFITGQAIYHTGWDASKLDVYDNGDCMFQVLPHADVYLDPMPGLTNIQRSRFFIVCFWLPINTILQRFGESASNALGIQFKGKSKSGNARFAGMDKMETRRVLNLGHSLNSESSIELFDPMGNLYPVYECWFRPKDYRVTQLANGQKTFQSLSPHGRVGYLVNGEVVEDTDNPFRQKKRVPLVIDDETLESRTVNVGHGQFPVVRQIAYQGQDNDGRKSLYDVFGVVEPIESLQWDINDLSRNRMINARTIANPTAVVNEKRLIAPKSGDLTAYPNAKIVVTDDGPISEAFHYEKGGELSPSVSTLHQEKHLRVETISGVKGFVAGNIHRGTSHTTAEGTALVSEADFSMMWTLIHSSEKTMTTVIRHFSGLQQQFYKIGRFTSVSLNGQEVFTEWSSRNVGAEFFFDVVSGSATPQQDIQRIQHITFAMQTVAPVLENPTPDSIQLALFALEAANLPWTHEITQFLRQKLETIEQEQQQEAMVQQLLAAAAIGAGGGANPLGTQQGGVPLLANQLDVSPQDLVGGLT